MSVISRKPSTVGYCATRTISLPQKKAKVEYKPPGYDVNFFAALRYMCMDMRKLTLLIQSRTPFGALLPRDHPLSDMDIKTVELRGSR